MNALLETTKRSAKIELAVERTQQVHSCAFSRFEQVDPGNGAKIPLDEVCALRDSTHLPPQIGLRTSTRGRNGQITNDKKLAIFQTNIHTHMNIDRLERKSSK